MENLENSEIEKEKYVLVEEYKKILKEKIKTAEGRKDIKIIAFLGAFFFSIGFIILFIVVIVSLDFNLWRSIFFKAGLSSFIFGVILIIVASVLIPFFENKKINKKTFSSEELSNFLEEKKEELRGNIEEADEDIQSELTFLENAKKDAEEEIKKITKRKEEQSAYLQELEKIIF